MQPQSKRLFIKAVKLIILRFVLDLVTGVTSLHLKFSGINH